MKPFVSYMKSQVHKTAWQLNFFTIFSKRITEFFYKHKSEDVTGNRIIHFFSSFLV